MKLNTQQNDAVKYIAGPCLVLAGAGSGKTRVITNKIAYLIEECGMSARHIAAVTFTNKAAREMKERISHQLDRSKLRGLTVSTFHTLGLEIIKKEHKAIGYKANFTLFDDQDSMALLKELTEADLQNDKDLLRALQSKISNWKNDLLLPPQALAQAMDAQSISFANYYAQYAQQLRAYHALDFDDLIVLTVKLLKENPEVRAFYQNKYKYLMVDEFQDVNGLQVKLLDLLLKPENQLFCVGDDWQSIYGFRGSDVEYIVNYEKYYKDCEIYKLEVNYRSTQTIVGASNEVIKNNKRQISKEIKAFKKAPNKIQIFRAKSLEEDGVEFLVEEVKKLYQKGMGKDDILVLYRRSKMFNEYLRALKENRLFVSSKTYFLFTPTSR